MPADSESPLSYPHRNDEYAYRVPTPPRIVVPPPTLNSEALPDISLGASSLLPNPGDAYKNLVSTNPVFDWAYERRRDAQWVLPYLYLGPMTAAKDEAWLHKEGITMVLGIRQRYEFSFRLMDGTLRRAQEAGVEARTVDLANNQDLIHSFPECTALINSHLSHVYSSTGHFGKVLVFCESGNERSAGVIAAYLMETHDNVDYIKAMQLCQTQRFCVNFDDAMKRLLQGYWDILCAKRAVAANDRMCAQSSQNYTKKSKRGLERDDEDEDMDAMQVDDFQRFGGRTFTPFMDASI